MQSFTTIGLTDTIAAALASFGFEAPTSAQAQAIPLLLAKRDLFLESETGTGKTFAYLAPALQLIGGGGRAKVGEPSVLIAAPTQELAVQIGREAERLVMAAGASVRVAVLLGGTALDKQLAKLKDKPDIVVGTLGRLRDLLAVKKLSAKALRLMVLDEADRLFAPETSEMAAELLRAAPPACPRALVSATLPDKVRRAALKYLADPADISADDTEVLSADIEHWCFYCDGRKRLDFVRKFEAAVRPERCLMFLSLATRIESVAERLVAIGLPIAAIHAGLDKEARRTALERFATGQIRYLLTSDLGARGLDIAGITHVLSLDLPEEPTIYTHRAGRTGRAGAKGVSIVLADGVELERASRMAVRGGFVFRCKIMEAAQIFEPTSEEFFARARAAEDDRLQAKASKLRDPESRRPSPRRAAGAAGTHRGRGDSEGGGAEGGPARRRYGSEGGHAGGSEGGYSSGSEGDPARRRYGAENGPAGGPARRSYNTEGGPEKRPYGTEGGPEKRVYRAEGGKAKRVYDSETWPEKRAYVAKGETEGGPARRRYGAEGNSEGGPAKRRYNGEGGPAKRSYTSEDKPDKRSSYAPEGGPAKRTYVAKGAADSGPARRSYSSEGGPAKRSYTADNGPARRSYDSERSPAKRSYTPEGGPARRSNNADSGPAKRAYVAKGAADGTPARRGPRADGPARTERRPKAARDDSRERPRRNKADDGAPASKYIRPRENAHPGSDSRPPAGAARRIKDREGSAPKGAGKSAPAARKAARPDRKGKPERRDDAD